MNRPFFTMLCGALLLVMGFSSALAGLDTADGFWDAALGIYISWDDSRQVYFISDPDTGFAWAYEPTLDLYYVYDQATDRLFEVGYVDASGAVVETGGSGGEMETDPSACEAALEMLRRDSAEIRRAIAEMNGPDIGGPGGAGVYDH